MMLDVCPWRAALSHGAQAFSFALLGGIKALHVISSWHPTCRRVCALNPACWAGINSPGCLKESRPRQELSTAPSQLRCHQVPHPNGLSVTSCSRLIWAPHAACPAAGLCGRRQARGGTLPCNCSRRRGFTPSAKIRLLASLQGWKSSAGIRPASTTAPARWVEQDALLPYVYQSLGIDVILELWLSSPQKSPMQKYSAGNVR